MKEEKFLILYTSDLHGNIMQFRKLFEKALKIRADAIIIGGDITPKEGVYRTISGQRHFLEKKLVPLIKSFNGKCNEKKHKVLVFIIMGNDDFKSNYNILKKYEWVGFKLIHNKAVRLHKDFKIVGYPYVPLTPFSYKDWEKLDLNNEDEYKTRNNFVVEGVRSRENQLHKFKFNLKNRKDTIETDLNKILRKLNSRKTVMVIHSPPYNTSLDLTHNEHVGSLAVRRMIEKRQPYLTLHGHVHETVDISKRFMEKIKDTTCIVSGNYHNGKSLALVKFDLYNPSEAIREII